MQVTRGEFEAIVREVLSRFRTHMMEYADGMSGSTMGGMEYCVRATLRETWRAVKDKTEKAVTPESAKAASLANAKGNKALERFEGEIERAAKKGLRSAMLCYTDCVFDAERDAISELYDRGFKVFTDRNGNQHTAWYCRW